MDISPEGAVLVAIIALAALLAGIELIRTRGQDLLAWAVLLIALVLIPGRQL